MDRALGLRPRLMAIALRIPSGARVADIGTDHARLPVYLMEQGIASSVIATDRSEGPLLRARRTIALHKLEGVIPLRLCDGASGLDPDEIDTAVLAGMGGETIRDIVRKSPWLRHKRLIVQPQTRQLLLPRWLAEEGYTLRDKAEVFEGHRCYRVYVFEEVSLCGQYGT